MRGEPRHRRAAPCGHQPDGPVVIRGAEAEAAVFLGDLHAPGTELTEPVEQLVVVLAALVDAVGVDILSKEPLQPRKERVALSLVIGRLLGEWMNQIDIELAEKKIADE